MSQQENVEELTPKERKSIFNTGYLAHPDTSLLAFQNKAYFRLHEAVGAAVNLDKTTADTQKQKEAAKADASMKDAQKVTAEPGKFWEIAMTRYEESHAEKCSLHQSLAEGIVLHCAGSEPIRITIEGYLPSGADMDYRVRFLRKYIMAFRERKLSEAQRTLEVHVRRTSFMLEINSIVMEEAADLSDYTVVSITGIAHHYNTDDGTVLSYDVESAATGSTAPKSTVQGVEFKAVTTSIKGINAGITSLGSFIT